MMCVRERERRGVALYEVYVCACVFAWVFLCRYVYSTCQYVSACCLQSAL